MTGRWLVDWLPACLLSRFSHSLSEPTSIVKFLGTAIVTGLRRLSMTSLFPPAVPPSPPEIRPLASLVDTHALRPRSVSVQIGRDGEKALSASEGEGEVAIASAA